jgi:hypothetical protein
MTAPPGGQPRIDRIVQALVQVEAQGELPDLIRTAPGEFLRDLYKAWVENGGRDGGKNRNSIRRMREWLATIREVKSLHPKLTGKVRLAKDDASALIELFLGRWQYGATEADWAHTPDGYRPFPCEDCKALRDRLADALFPPGSVQAEAGLLLPTQADEALADDARSAWSEITSLYHEADAVITLSRHRSTLGATPAETLKGFWHLINHLYAEIGTKDVILIWIVDIGSRLAEDEEAWWEFVNFELVKAQFRAFATFDSITDEERAPAPHGGSRRPLSPMHDAFLRGLVIPEEDQRARRWRWLCERTVIIVQNLRQEEFASLYTDEDKVMEKLRLKDTGVTAEHILPSTLPHRWGRLKELRELYGSGLENIADATITVFYRMAGWGRLGAEEPIDDIRYYAHALVPEEARRNTFGWADTARSRLLNSPGPMYDEAIRIAYWAARYRLRRKADRSLPRQDWAIAAAYLKTMRFQLLRLPDFLRIHRLPGEAH